MTDLDLGSRIHSGFCVQCGSVLLHPYNDYQMCVECTGRMEHGLKKLAKKRAEADKKRKSLRNDYTLVVNSRNIKRQIAPIGVPVK